MGTRNRFNPCKPCCCAFENSDDNYYGLDTFGSLDAGWVKSGFPWYFNAAGGYLIGSLYKGSSGTGTIHRAMTLPADKTGLEFITQVTIWKKHATYSRSMAVALWKNGGPVNFQLLADFTGNEYEWTSPWGSGSKAVAPADGDRLTVIVRHVNGDTYRACYFLNSTLVGQESGELTAAQWGTVYHARILMDGQVPITETGTVDCGQADDFTIHLEP